MVARNAAHEDLVEDVCKALSDLGALCWKHPTGEAPGLRGGWVQFGLRGSGDIIAVLPPDGRFLSVEVKTGSGRQTGPQRNFQRAVERVGGRYVVARSVKDAVDAVAP